MEEQFHQIGWRNPKVSTILHTEAQHERWGCEGCLVVFERRQQFQVSPVSIHAFRVTPTGTRVSLCGLAGLPDNSYGTSKITCHDCIELEPGEIDK